MQENLGLRGLVNFYFKWWIEMKWWIGNQLYLFYYELLNYYKNFVFVFIFKVKNNAIEDSKYVLKL